MLSCYDQRPLPEIIHHLLGEEINHDDLVAAVIVLAGRVVDIERKIKQQESGPKA